MMRLWGRKNSINVQKILWCLLELGLHEGKDFERIDAGLQFGKNHTPEFLKLNPNGLVPTLEDEDMVLWESNTIMRYLARTHDRNHRVPTDIKSKYHSEKWYKDQLRHRCCSQEVWLYRVDRHARDSRIRLVVCDPLRP